MNHKRGDVLLVVFPDSTGRSAKRRPAIVIKADGLTTNLAQIVLAMISSNSSRAGLPSRVWLPMNSQKFKGIGIAH
jgi:mRNA interferase MazF